MYSNMSLRATSVDIATYSICKPNKKIRCDILSPLYQSPWRIITAHSILSKLFDNVEGFYESIHIDSIIFIKLPRPTVSLELTSIKGGYLNQPFTTTVNNSSGITWRFKQVKTQCNHRHFGTLIHPIHFHWHSELISMSTNNLQCHPA